jgi:hypothetical protein
MEVLVVFAFVVLTSPYWWFWLRQHVFRFPPRPDTVCKVCGIDATETGCPRVDEPYNCQTLEEGIFLQTSAVNGSRSSYLP